MTIQQLRFLICIWLFSLCALGATAQQVFESQLLRFRTEVVATGLKQPSALIFLPDGRRLLVERQKGIDLLDVKSGTVTTLDGRPQALIGADTCVHSRY